MENAMKPIYAVLCLAAVVCCQVSCEEVREQDALRSDVRIESSEERFRSLVDRARNGDTRAYEALAICYRDGDGVVQSDLNAIFATIFARQDDDWGVEQLMELFDEEAPTRLMLRVLDYSDMEDVPPADVARLRAVSPADAMVYDAICAVEMRHDTAETLRLLQTAEDQGSEFACIARVNFYIDCLDDMPGYKRMLLRHADRYPLFYNKLGEIEMEEGDDPEHLRRAVSCFRKADKQAMLSARGARLLLTACRRLGGEASAFYDAEDLNRIARSAR